MGMTGCECVAGILVSVKTRAQQKMHKLKESYDHLVQRVTELQERTDKLVIPYSCFILKPNSNKHRTLHIQIETDIHDVLGARATTEDIDVI